MKKYNLIDLLDGEVDVEHADQTTTHALNGIEIPIIQRDYAHGRKSATKIRERFLDAVFTAVSKPEELELDFLYGSIKSKKTGVGDTSVFLPLDGQQRLTTIFLIYWYVANAELEGEELTDIRETLGKFSYSTRSTARLFCEKLSTIGYKNGVVPKIKSAYWFHKKYEKDPTVMGMLNTLEDVEKKYCEQKKKLFHQLNNLCFYILPLDGFDLTDELYIKMNARGKPLTDFENFKADLINWMTSDENTEKHKFGELAQLGDSKAPWYLSLASHLDNRWTDIFWPEAKLNVLEDDKIVDNYFFRFINRFILNESIITSNESVSNIEKTALFQLLYSGGKDAKIKYDSFESYKAIMSADRIKRLETGLNSIYEQQSKIREIIRPVWDQTDNWFLYDSEIIQTQRILFLAVTQYMERNVFDEEGFKDWVRVVWNIIADPDIRSIGAMITAMKTIANLSKGAGNINAYVRSEEFERLINELKENMHKEQLKEEKKKAQLFADSNWKKEILRAEAHPLFQGNIGFLLTDEPDLTTFSHRVKMAFSLFNKNGTDSGFIPNHGVFRYCISKFKSWKEIEDFRYIDGPRNWQLSLRRNESVKESILNLCSLKESELHEEIAQSIKAPSNAIGWNGAEARLRLTHFNLYAYPDFVKWTQKTEDGNRVSTIKWIQGFWYIVRPRAWYDKVMIDGYRNEVISEVFELASISGDYHNLRCGSSEFFRTEEIKLFFTHKGTKWKMVFNPQNHIEVYKAVQQNDEKTWELVHKDKDTIRGISDSVGAKKIANDLWGIMDQSQR